MSEPYARDQAARERQRKIDYLNARLLGIWPFDQNGKLLPEQPPRYHIALDASDADLCDTAQRASLECWKLSETFHTLPDLRQACERMAHRYGITPPTSAASDAGAVARMTDESWWRRRLRVMHGRTVEADQINAGRVNKSKEIYVSDASVKRRAKQNKRNAEAMENTVAVNEFDQEFTLAELAAKGTANKSIKRAELMTRINGFERIANDVGHAGLFATLTCPSRFHAFRTVAGWKTEPNPRYEQGLTPRDGGHYLGKVWARIRAKLHRLGIKPYGFRVAEPQQDGTPHWHLLVFMAAHHLESFKQVFRAYAMKDSPGEPGAHKHRVDFKHMDTAKGTAAGYIAKYIAKNIDGYGIEKDLHGNDAITASMRVEAWASTWGIRQFQQVGGAPVGPWREARRVKAIEEGAPEHLKAVHRAVNKTTQLEGKTEKSVSWKHYTKAQGGVHCGRKYLVRVCQIDKGGLNKYGEPAGQKPIGIETYAMETYTSQRDARHGLKVIRQRSVYWFAESTRYQWTIKARRKPANGRVFSGQGASLAPWTRVNNCTNERFSDGRDNTGESKSEDFGGKERIPESLDFDQGASWAGFFADVGCDSGDAIPDRLFNDGGSYVD